LNLNFFSQLLFIIPNYFDTLQFEANTLHPEPAPWDAIMVHALYFRLNIQNHLEDKKSLFRKLYMLLTLTLR